MADVLMNAREVARLLDCSPDDVLEWARAGKIRGQKVGARVRRFWRFERRHVLAFRRKKIQAESKRRLVAAQEEGVGFSLTQEEADAVMETIVAWEAVPKTRGARAALESKECPLCVWTTEQPQILNSRTCSLCPVVKYAGVSCTSNTTPYGRNDPAWMVVEYLYELLAAAGYEVKEV